MFTKIYSNYSWSYKFVIFFEFLTSLSLSKIYKFQILSVKKYLKIAIIIIIIISVKTEIFSVLPENVNHFFFHEKKQIPKSLNRPPQFPFLMVVFLHYYYTKVFRLYLKAFQMKRFFIDSNYFSLTWYFSINI